MELTTEQARVVAERPEAAHPMTDPLTRRRYVLLPEETLERLRRDAAEIRADEEFARAWTRTVARGRALALGNDGDEAR